MLTQPLRYLPQLLLFAGLLWALASLPAYLQRRALLHNGVQAGARLAELNLQRVGYRQRLTCILEFTPDGEPPQRIRGRAGFSWKEDLREGDTVRIVYPAEHPADARLLATVERAPFGLPAGLFLVLLGGIVWGLRKFESLN